MYMCTFMCVYMYMHTYNTECVCSDLLAVNIYTIMPIEWPSQDEDFVIQLCENMALGTREFYFFFFFVIKCLGISH